VGGCNQKALIFGCFGSYTNFSSLQLGAEASS
jgi:hypothetical protein